MAPQAYPSGTHTPALLHIGAHCVLEGVHRACRQACTFAIFPLNVWSQSYYYASDRLESRADVPGSLTGGSCRL